MGDQHDDATRQVYFLAQLETDDDREWDSLHLTYEDAERQLKAVGTAWGVGFTLDGEPADGFRRYAIAEVPVLGPEESGQAPEEPLEFSLTKEEEGTWLWLVIVTSQVDYRPRRWPTTSASPATSRLVGWPVSLRWGWLTR